MSKHTELLFEGKGRRQAQHPPTTHTKQWQRLADVSPVPIPAMNWTMISKPATLCLETLVEVRLEQLL